MGKTATETAVEQNLTVQVEAEGVGQERVEEAKAMGVTPGKLNLVDKLKGSSDETAEINEEEWLEKPVKDIMKQIKENQKATSLDVAGTYEDIGEQAADAKEAGNNAAVFAWNRPDWRGFSASGDDKDDSKNAAPKEDSAAGSSKNDRQGFPASGDNKADSKNAAPKEDKTTANSKSTPGWGFPSSGNGKDDSKNAASKEDKTTGNPKTTPGWWWGFPSSGDDKDGSKDAGAKGNNISAAARNEAERQVYPATYRNTNESKDGALKGNPSPGSLETVSGRRSGRRS